MSSLNPFSGTSHVGDDVVVDPAENITRLFRSWHYNDDGLFFSLAFGGVIFLSLGLLLSCLLRVPVRWMRRLYRPNHTLSPHEASVLFLQHEEEEESDSNVAAEEENAPQGASMKQNSMSTTDHRRRTSRSSTRSSSSSRPMQTNRRTQVFHSRIRRDSRRKKPQSAVEGPPTTTEEEEGFEVGMEDLNGEEGRQDNEDEKEEEEEDGTLPLPAYRAAPPKKRRKGILLPYRSALFCLASWKDWWSVEEDSLPYLQPLFPPSHTSSSSPFFLFSFSSAAAAATTTTAEEEEEDTIAVGHHKEVNVVITEVDDYSEQTGKAEGERPREIIAAGPPFSLPSPVGMAPTVAVTSSPSSVSGSSSYTSSSPFKGAAYPFMDGMGNADAPPRRRRKSSSSSSSGGDEEQEKEERKNVKEGKEDGGGGGPRPCEEEEVAPPLPAPSLQYVDPQVSLYLFTLKYAFTFLFAGVLLFNSWILLISSRGDYVATSTKAQNADFCHMLDGSKDRCMAVAPKCAYAENITTILPTTSTSSTAVPAFFRSSSFWGASGEEKKEDSIVTSHAPKQTGWGWGVPSSYRHYIEKEEEEESTAITRYEGECFSVAVPGLAQLSVENIPAGSALWWGVAICNIGFTLVFVVCTIFFVQKVNVFVEQVMREQMRHATGYRVACVRGLDAEKEGVLSEAEFRKKYLTRSAYFHSRHHPRHHPPSHSPSLTKSATGDNDNGGGGGGAAVSSAEYRVKEAEEEEEEGGILTHSVSCWRLDCLYSILRCESYRTTPRDATFTQPGRVLEISFVRDAPSGMYRAIKKTKEAKAALEEVVAHEKALQASYRTTTHASGVFSSASSASPLRRRAEGRRSPSPSSFSSSSMSCHPRRGLSPVSTASHEEEEDEGEDDDGKKRVPVETERRAKKRKPRDGGEAAVRHPTHSREVVFEAPSSSPSTDHHPTNGTALPTLYCRAPLRSGLRRIPAVSYFTDRYRERTKVLNQYLRQVPDQRTAGSVFIRFADARSTFEFVQLFNDWKGGGWWKGCSAVVAGPASGILHGNLPLRRPVLCARVFIFFILFTALVLFWSIPIGLLSSANNLAVLPGVGLAFYEAYLTYVSPTARLFISAYLPIFVVALFNLLLPHIIRWMMAGMGVFNETERFGGRLYFQYLFMVLAYVIFQMALQGGIRQLSEMVLSGVDMDTASTFFVSCVMPHGGYWYAKVILGLSMSTWLELLEFLQLLTILWHRGTAHVQRGYDALFKPSMCFDFPSVYSADLTMLSVGLLFHMTCPLLTLFVALYFLVRYHTMRQRLYERYRPGGGLEGSSLAGGGYHPAHDCTNFGISALVVRIAVSLFMLSEFCAVCLFTIRSHTGGQVVSALTFFIGAGLWMWVFLQSRCWVPCLENARRFMPTPPPLSSSSSSGGGGGPSLRSPTTASVETQKRRPQRSPTPTLSTGGGGEGAVMGRSTPPLQVVRPPVLSRTEEAEEEEEGALSTPSKKEEKIRKKSTSSGHSHSSSFSRASNGGGGTFSTRSVSPRPFSDPLLPSQSSLLASYHPKHQRLAPIDVDADVAAMKATDHVVEPYWT